MLQKHFEVISDRRAVGCVRHNLLEVVVMTICAVASGCEYWYQIADYCKHQEEWFRDKLGLKLTNGTPSKDTFRRVMEIIDPQQFEQQFSEWIRAVCKIKQDIIGIDGKTIRSSRTKDNAGVYLVSAWASKNGVVIGQERTQDKSNEITAVPKLLQALALQDCIITIDAMGTQKDIAKLISKDNDYVLAVKGNHKNLYKDISIYFEETIQDKQLYIKDNTITTIDSGHGRQEQRAYYLSTDLDWLEQKAEWAKIKAIGAVWSDTIRKGKSCSEQRYYITTLDNIEQFAKAVRSHWGIENSLHWCLDVVFKEDNSRIRTQTTIQNFAVIRKVVLNILKKLPTEKYQSLNAKRLRCHYNFEYLANAILSVLSS